MPVINDKSIKKEKSWGKKSIHTILSTRTEKLVLRGSHTSPLEASIQILSFSLGNQEKYGFPMNRISKVIQLEHWTPVPKSHDLIQGVISFNTELFCLMKLINILGLNKKTDGDFRYALAIKHTQNCLMIESPKEIYTIHPDDMIPPSHKKENRITPYTRGVVMNDLIVLDTDRILAHPVFNHI